MQDIIYNLQMSGITGFKLVLILILGSFLALVGFGILLSIFMFLLRKLLRRNVDLVLMQITVPKFSGDKEDNGQPKTQQELAEKIALGEAFFNSIANTTSQKGFIVWLLGRTDYYSFEIVLKDNLIYFYAACPRDMKDYVAQQITSQYADAHIITIEDYNIFPAKGVIAASEIKLKKDYIFPIKTYRQLESDPLSAITTAISKLPPGSGAAVQFLVRSAHPKWHDWGHKAAMEATQGKKLQKAIRETKGGISLSSNNLIGSFFGMIGSGLGTVWHQFTDTSMKESVEGEKKPEAYSLTQKEQEVVKGIEEKASKGGLECNIRLMVACNNANAAKIGLEGLVNTFFQFNIYEFGNAFTESKPSKSKMIKRFIFREFNEKNVAILNSEEAASVFHFPLGYLETPNIVWLLSKKAPPPLDLPTSGLLLGYNDYRGVRTPIFIKEADRRRHMYVIGMTGTGKSKFLDTMVIRDIREGRGVCFIDPHGDDVDLILASIPKERAEDIVYFDPSDVERPFGLNMLEYDFNKPEDKIFVVNQVFQIFDKLYDLKATGGPMFEQYMKNACMLIMDDPESGSTLMEIPRVLADEEYRNYKLSKCRTQVVKDFWEKEATKAGGEASLANMVPYITSKLTPFIANDLIRPIISQQKTTLDFVDAMNNKKIILVNVAKGKIGDINSNLIGMVIIGKILQAAFSRVNIPENERTDFFLYIDEFHNFLTDSMSTILSEARKYRLSLTMAHQFIGQLVVNGDERIKDSIFGNVGTKIAFRIGVDDSEAMEKEFAPVFNAYDVMNIPKYNCIMKLLVDNANPPSFNMAIPYVEAEFPPNWNMTGPYKQLSKLKFGKPKAIIEAEVEARRSFGLKPPKPKKEEISLEDLFK